MRFSKDVEGIVRAVAPKHLWAAIASHLTTKLNDKLTDHRRKLLASAAAELGEIKKFKPPKDEKKAK